MLRSCFSEEGGRGAEWGGGDCRMCCVLASLKRGQNCIIIIILIIIKYIYHALINALSAHMIHIILNMIFYTHVKHSPTKTIYIKYYKK